jgi:hypothetical protein
MKDIDRPPGLIPTEPMPEDRMSFVSVITQRSRGGAGRQAINLQRSINQTADSHVPNRGRTIVANLRVFDLTLVPPSQL